METLNYVTTATRQKSLDGQCEKGTDLSIPEEVGWDGTYNGQLMPSDDYWFTVSYEENGEQKEFKSHFAMKR